MRGRSSSAKARLRSAGYKCNLCGRRLIDAATLERHQKTIHNVSSKENKVSIKPKPQRPIHKKPTNKEKEKIFTNLRKEHILDQTKLKKIRKNNYEDRDVAMKDLADEKKMINDKKLDLIENGKNISNEEADKSVTEDNKNASREIHFVCPACGKTFTVYFNAQRHIQKAHHDLPKIRPIRVEKCFRCDSKIRSDEEHSCRKAIEEHITEIAEYVCSGCNQIFVSLKSFDMHVAGLHSDAVDSMFFPSKLEFVTWRLEMERQTNSKYSLYGEYESKKIYRCNYARNDSIHDKYTAYFCPSSMVVQEFSKGIQVHYYYQHYDHSTNPYSLSSKYKKYSITSFLTIKSPNVESYVASVDDLTKSNDKDLFPQFKKLMDSIVTNAAEVDTPVLKNLIEKALEMSAIVTDVAVSETASTLKATKNMSDKEIAEALEMKTDVNKRRRSVDSCEIPPKAAKRTRNKSLLNQSPSKLSPKIVNTFSLASNCNSEEFKPDNPVNIDFTSIKSDNTDKVRPNQSKNAPESDTFTNKYTKMSTRLSTVSESLSFNDSYKDFIDKNFIAKTDPKPTKNTVKTKLGAFKQISPSKAENKDDSSEMIAVNRGLKPLSSNKPKIEEASKTISMETPKLNILSIETPNVTITKVSKVDAPKVTDSQVSKPKVNTSKKKGFSYSVDPLQMNITKVNKDVSASPNESFRGNVTKRNTRNTLSDPLEMNVSKVKPRNAITSTPQDNIVKTVSKTAPSSVDLLKLNTAKTNITKVNTKIGSVKNSLKVYSGPGTPKMGSPGIRTSKVTFANNAASPSSAKLTPQKKITELKYEVREQENDCNILILKF